MNAYDGRQTRILADIAELDAECSHVEVTKQGKRLLVADRSGTVTKSLYHNGHVVERVQLHRAEIAEVKYDPVDRLLLTVSADRSIKLSAEDKLNHPIKTLEQISESQLTYAAASQDLGLVATASEAERARVWRVSSMDLVGVLGATLDICAMRFAAPRALLFTADFAGKVYGWNASSFDSLTSPILALELSGDYLSCMEPEVVVSSHSFLTAQQDAGLRLFLGTELGLIQVWDLSSSVATLPVLERPSSTSLLKPIVSSAQRFESLLQIGAARNAILPNSLSEKNRSKLWQACQGAVVELVLAAVPDSVLISIGHEADLSIWTCQGDALARLDLRESVPLFWNLRINTFQYRAELYAEGEKLLKQLALTSEKQEGETEQEPVRELVDVASKPYRRKEPQKTVERKVVSLRQMEARKVALLSMGDDFNQAGESQLPRHPSSLSHSQATTPTHFPATSILATKLEQRISHSPSPPRPEPQPEERRVVDYIETLDNTSDEIMMEYLSAKHALQHPNRSFSSDKFPPRRGARLRFMQELTFSRNRSKNSRSTAFYLTNDPLPPPDIRVRRRLLPQESRQRVQVAIPQRISQGSSPAKIQQKSAQDLLKRFEADKTFSKAARCLMKFYAS